MNEAVRTTMRVVVSTAGGVLAGPAGVLAGTLVGGLLTAVLPGGSALVETLARELAKKGVELASTHLTDRLTPQEKQTINHDLQTAFRDALREALFDVGGKQCFPELERTARRDVPVGVCYADSGQGRELWLQSNPLAGQVAGLLQSLRKELDEDKILPLNPPADQLAASAQAFLQAQTPQELEKAFFSLNIQPHLAKYPSLLQEIPDFEAHLRQHLYPRTMVHFAEHLKHRTPAWRAFNRMVLEELQGNVSEIKEGQAEILTRLDVLLKERDGRALTEFSAGMADLMAATAQVEKVVNESFEALSLRVVAQHKEILERFDRLDGTTTRIEDKVDQVLSVLQTGQPGWRENQSAIPLRKPPAPGEAPYKGLQEFNEADADWFFGRELLTAHLVERLQVCQFLTIIGASGSGKSSLVRAGLVPVLKGVKALQEVPVTPQGSTRWPVHIITPGERPLEALAVSFTRGGEASQAQKLMLDLRQEPRTLALVAGQQAAENNASGVLLVVDQFEELFTQCNDPAERSAFVSALLASGGPHTNGPLVLVLVLRADFYAECAQFDDLRVAISAHQEYIGPMTPEELQRAIEMPARKGGWTFEPGLVELMIQDAGSEPGALPLLSHALLETWKRRSGHTLLLSSYHEAGGVKGAIALTAEWILTQRFSSEQQGLARNIFLRLTNVAEGVQETRRRATLVELLSGGVQDDARHEVLDLLVEARLITVEEDNVQVSHEALIREWPRLREWIAENRAGLRIQHRITEAAAEWNRSLKDEGLLFRGSRLTEAREYFQSNPDSLNPLEVEFLNASIQLEERQKRQQEEQQRRELEAAQQLAEAQKERAETQARSAAQLKRRAMYLTAALAGVGVMVLLAVILLISALKSEKQAAANAATAEAASTQAVAQQATAEAASRLAVAQQATAEAERARAEQSAEQARARQLAALSQSALLENSPQRSLLLAVEAVDLAQSSVDPGKLSVANALWESVVNTGGTPILRQDHSVYQLALSPDGRWLASAALQESIQIWDLQAADPQANPIQLTGHTEYISGLAFTPDGETLLSASYDGSLRRWDLSEADPALTAIQVNMDAGKILQMAVSSDGLRIYTGGEDGSIAKWDFANVSAARPEWKLTGHPAPIFALALSLDEHWLVSGDSTGQVRLWDLQSADPGASGVLLSGHTAGIYTAAISPDAHWAATAGEDDSILLWDLTAENPADAPVLLAGHGEYISQVVFSPDSNWLVSASGDKTLRRWNLVAPSIPESSLVLSGHTDAVWGVRISPDGKWLISNSLDHTAHVWSMEFGEDSKGVALKGHDAMVAATVVSGDSHYLYTSSDDASIRRWDLTAASPQALPILLNGHTVGINGLVFTRDGSGLYSASVDRTTGVWDVSTGQLLQKLAGHDKAVYSLSLNADETRLVTFGFDGQVLVYDLTRSDRPLLWRLGGFADIATAARFSPDGRWLYTSCHDGTLRSYDLTAANVESSGKSFIAHPDGIQFMELSPDGHWLVTGGWDWFVRLWDVSAGELADPAYEFSDCTGPLAFSLDGARLAAVCDLDSRVWNMADPAAEPLILTGAEGLVFIVALSPDGRWLATGGDYRSVYLWDLASGNTEPAAVLRGHLNDITTIKFTSDSAFVLSASKDQTVRVWDLSSPDPELAVLTLRTPEAVYALGVDPTGNWLATGNMGGEIRLWPLNLTEVRRVACALAGRSFYPVEWDVYFPNQEYQTTCP